MLTTATWYETVILCSALILVGAIALMYVARKLGTDILGPMVIMLAMLTIGLVVQSWAGPYFLTPDGARFDQQAANFSDSLRGLRPWDSLAVENLGWPVLLGSFYAIFGRMPEVGVVLNAVAIAASAIFVARTSLVVFGRTSRWGLIAVYLLSPVIVATGPTLAAGSWLWLGAAMLATGMALASSHARQSLVCAISASAILLLTKFSLGLIVILVMALVWTTVRWILRFRLAWLEATVVSAVLAGSLGAGLGGIAAGSANTSRDFVAATSPTVVNIPRVLLGPFPWEIAASDLWLWHAANIIFWVALVAVATYRLVTSTHKEISVTLWITAFVLLIGLSLVLRDYQAISELRGIPAILLSALAVGSLKKPSFRESNPVPRSSVEESKKRPARGPALLA
jgi:hypothetical protein